MDHGLEAAGVAQARAPRFLMRQNADKPVAAMTADETRDALYEECSGIRLDLIYCRALPGELRKRWANRLGGIDLRASDTPAVIERLHEGLGVFASDGDSHAELDLSEIRGRLYRLRTLCLRYQQLLARAKS